MALDTDLQTAFGDAWDVHAEHLGDEVTIGLLTLATVATIVDESEEDEGGGDVALRTVRIQVRRSSLTAGIPALNSTITYKGDDYRLESIQKADDEVTISFRCREDL